MWVMDEVALRGVPSEAVEALRNLVDEYRTRCLWYLSRDYYPATVSEALRVLAAIERHGDREGFRRAGQIRRWLSLDSSEVSAGS
jgi:hypothetical protein